jgi:hypothetical protein
VRDESGFEAGIQRALQRLLMSPEFLVRIERDPANVAPGTNYRISDLELASRLSFFLWSTIPDDELLDLAERGRLKDPAVLRQQVRRMLADSRSKAFVTNFTGQWLYLRNVRAATPDSLLFPDFDDNLRQALQRETEMLFETIVHEDRSALDLLGARYTFVNERLARHYGIADVYGNEFRRIELSDKDPRGGLLGQGSILAVTSYPNRTSPVQRGKWLLENVLGAPPPPPPPNVPDLEEKNAEGRVLSSGWCSIAPTRSVRAVTREWIRSGSRSRTSTRWAVCGRRASRVRRSTRPAPCPTAHLSPDRRSSVICSSRSPSASSTR